MPKKQIKFPSPLEIFQETIKNKQTEIKQAHDLLNAKGVPTNGLDIFGHPGRGKRQELSLRQRISFLKFESKSKHVEIKIYRDGTEPLRKGTLKCPNCGSKLHFETIGGIRIVREGILSAICPTEKIKFQVKS